MRWARFPPLNLCTCCSLCLQHPSAHACPVLDSRPVSSTPGLCPPSCSGPGCPRAPSLSSSHVLSGAWLALPRCGQAEVPTHRPTSLLAPTGVEGFTSQEDQELLSRIEKQLKRRFAIGSQVSEHSIIQDFTKQVGLQGRVPTHPVPCPALSRQAWDGVGAAVPGPRPVPSALHSRLSLSH